MSLDDESNSDDLRCHDGTSARKTFTFTFDETVAAALYAADKRVLGRTPRFGKPRSIFCNMGICFDCMVQIDGRPNQRACRQIVAHDMRVESQDSFGTWEST